MSYNNIIKATPEEYPEITRVWETSVRATHDFLKEEDILYFKPLILTEYLPAMEHLFYIKNEKGRIVAFIGIQEKHIEMLFVHPDTRGKGLGKRLIFFAIQRYHIETVDVNEQNEQGVGFYLNMGFEVTGRDTLDSSGKPFPILHMKLNSSLKKILSSNKPIEKHPLGFYLPPNAKVLMLGSFPPPRKRWSMDFYYPNIQNDMWRILGFLFYQDKEHFIIPGRKAFDKNRAEAFCQTYGIGIGDTAEEIVRMNDDASDKFLEVVKPWNAKKVLSQIPECHTIVITGQKAMETFLKVIPVQEPKVGNYTEFEFIGRSFRVYRMPSSSRAYPKPIEEKAVVYGKMFEEAGLLPG